MEVVAGLVQQSIREKASTVLGQGEYQKRYDALWSRFDVVKDRLDAVTAKIAEKTLRRDNIEHFLHDLMKQSALVTEFDPMVWHTTVEVVIVYSRENVRFVFKDGAEILTSGI